MGIFSSKNNTISDSQMADLSRRAQKADKFAWTSKTAIDRSKASTAQRGKANQS